MNLYDFLILTYPARLIPCIMRLERHQRVNWKEELLEFASYSLRTMVLQLLHYKIPTLSVTDVMCLSYPLRRLFDVFLRKRRKFPWKMEVKAVIFNWICYFVMEVYISKVLLGILSIALGGSIIEPLLWMIFVLCALLQRKIFIIIISLFDDDFLIQPLCASIAEHYPLYVAHPVLSSVYSDVLGIVVGRVD